MIQEDGIRLCGEFLRDKQFSISKRRFCPACLGESAYHRLWWDILAITECPFHRTRIEDSLPDGSPLMWWWPYFDHSPKGEYLGRKGIPRKDPGGTFAGYVLSRLGICNSPPAPLLDDMSLQEVIDTCDMLGRLLGSPRSARHPPSLESHPEIGFEALFRGPAHLMRKLRMWLTREVPEECRRRGHVVAFGWITDNRFTLSPRMSSLFNKAMKKALAAENRTVPRELSDADFYSDDIGIEALAQELGIVRRGVAAIADRLGILPEREWYRARVHFNHDEATRIRKFLDDVITTQEADRILGLPPGQLGPLVKAGFLDRLANVTGRGMRGSRYARSQVEGFLENMFGNIPEGEVKQAISLIVCARRMRMEPGGLVAMAAAGELAPVCRKPGSVGLMGLRFLEPALALQRRRRDTSQALRDRIKELALAKPMGGPRTYSKLLAEEDELVSTPTIRKHLIRMGLGRQEDRVKAAAST
ncbi:TniQ family protein [Mesorhizobium sp. M1050]|uniref:hypothetical protein n=1 Tax=Mesorhizobium sp. M1050 TaxID=2957051 RepID=UPI003338BD57